MSAAPPAVPPARPPWWLTSPAVLLFLAAAALLAYHNSFAAPFLFDDDSSIRDNPTIRSLGQAWWPPRENGVTVSGRPLLNFTLALNYAVGGTAVGGYHAVNLLIHVLAAGALFAVVRRTLRLPTGGARSEREAAALALAAAGLWLLHPLQTESVTYVIQRAESLVSLLYLVTLGCFLRAAEPGAAARWAPLTVGACLLGMASKEVMVTAPVVVLLYDRVFLASSWRAAWVRRGRLHLALAATWLLLAALVAGTGSRGGTAGLSTEVSPLAYALTQIGAVVHYLRLVAWPHPLVFDYGKGLVDGFGAVWGQALVLAPLAAGATWAAWRGRPAGFALCFFLAVLAPTSSFVPVATQTMTEHRVYLALAGPVVLAVVGLRAVAGAWSWPVFAAVALLFTGLTARRNLDYRSELHLWQDTAAKYPRNARAFATLGTIHEREGRLDEALAALRTALAVAPTTEAWNNLGNVWMKLARWPDAIACFEEALRLKPGQALVLNNLGNARQEAGDAAGAIASLTEAIRLEPSLTVARYNLANLLAQHGRAAEAVPYYAGYLRERPDDPEARTNLGNTLLGLDRLDEALAQLAHAAELRPESAEIQNNFGVALARAGRLAEARARFEEAVRLDPTFTRARENAARAARSLGGG